MVANRPNWFLGFPVRPEQGLQNLLASLPEGLRPFRPEDLHVTLAFLGPVEAEQADTVWATARTLRWRPFRVRARQARPFGPPRRPSAYGLVLDDDAGSLQRFMQAHQQRLRALAGLPAESRPPLPHLTLGRPRPRLGSAARTELARWCEQCELPENPLTLDELALYTWAEDRSQRLFRIVKRSPAPLGEAATRGPAQGSEAR